MCDPLDRVDGGDVVLADIDGDGRVEIVVTAENNGDPIRSTKRKVWYWSGWTSGSFASTSIDIDIGTGESVIAAPDVNGNGRQELVLSSATVGGSNASAMLEHRTGSRFYMERTVNNVMDSDWRFVGTQGDFNGDGATDLAKIVMADNPARRSLTALSYGHKLVKYRQIHVHRCERCRDKECGLFSGDFRWRRSLRPPYHPSWRTAAFRTRTPIGDSVILLSGGAAAGGRGGRTRMAI